jgi:hypothetical protein
MATADTSGRRLAVAPSTFPRLSPQLEGAKKEKSGFSPPMTGEVVANEFAPDKVAAAP